MKDKINLPLLCEELKYINENFDGIDIKYLFQGDDPIEFLDFTTKYLFDNYDVVEIRDMMYPDTSYIPPICSSNCNKFSEWEKKSQVPTGLIYCASTEGQIKTNKWGNALFTLATTTEKFYERLFCFSKDNQVYIFYFNQDRQSENWLMVLRPKENEQDDRLDKSKIF